MTLAHLPQRRRGSAPLALLVAGWAIAIGGGLIALWDYSSKPTAFAARCANWPVDSRLPVPGAKGQLTIFLHPHCPCSRASVAELADALAAAPNPPPAVAVFFCPPETDASWSRTDLWTSAAAIPGVTCVVDAGGTEANRFGAAVSGTVVLFDENKRRAFIGGITAGRGHRGDSQGNLSLTALFAGDQRPSGDVRTEVNGRPVAATAPAYGCGLRLSSAERSELE